jgi:hypothetical protein
MAPPTHAVVRKGWNLKKSLQIHADLFICQYIDFRQDKLAAIFQRFG